MKKIIIDGHNLVPNISGLSLADPNDEQKLIELVTEYCRLAKSQAELFFDATPVGYAGVKHHGLVTAHHVKKGLIADDAIQKYLQRSGKNARNLLVVSTDRRVQAEAKSLGAKVISSADFARQMQTTFERAPDAPSEKGSYSEQEEVDRWLDVMNRRKK